MFIKPIGLGPRISPQVLAENIMDTFAADGFMKVFKEPEDHLSHLRALGEAFAAPLQRSSSYMQKLVKKGEDEYLPALNTILENIERLTSIMKCLDFAWAMRLPFDSASTVQDVLRLTSPPSKQTPLLEKMLQEKIDSAIFSSCYL